MNSPAVSNEVKKSNKGKLIMLLTIILFLITLIALSVYYFHSKQVISAKDIVMNVRQNESISLPKTIDTELRNGTKSQALVEWSVNQIKTDKVGTTNIEGNVKGLSKQVRVTVNVNHFITSVEEISLSLYENDENWLALLPQSVNVVYNDNTEESCPVHWITSNVNIGKEGEVKIKGDIISSKCSDSEDEAICNITVVAVNKLLKEMLIKNEFSKMPDVKIALSYASKLPESLIKRVHDAGIKIEFVKEDMSNDNPYLKNGKVVGQFSPSESLIKVKYEMYDYSTLLHELAHAIDWTATSKNYELSIGNKKFMNIFKSEANKLFTIKTVMDNPEYCTKQPEEYFAESFAWYYLWPEAKKQLKDLAPQTYDYIESIK